MNRKKVLIIDDEVNIAETLADILSLKGYEVYTALDGKRGLSMAVNNKPDLILCDIMMPLMNGYDVLEGIRKHQNTQNVPFIFLTAKGKHDNFRVGMDMGADDYLVKPIDSNDLFRVLEKRLNRQETLIRAGQLEENERLSKDLHDTLQQTLLALQMKLTRLRGITTDKGHLLEVNESLDFVRLAFSQLRMILENTDAMVQDKGFVDGLEQMIRRVSRYVEFQISVQNDLAMEVSRTKARVLFKVILEALNNIIKYAQAKKVFIHLTGDDKETVMVILDDGKGFDKNKVPEGNGLRNIRERVEELGGSVVLDSEEGSGTTLEVVL